MMARYTEHGEHGPAEDMITDKRGQWIYDRGVKEGKDVVMWIIIVNKTSKDVRYIGPFQYEEQAKEMELALVGLVWVQSTQITQLTQCYVDTEGRVRGRG